MAKSGLDFVPVEIGATDSDDKLFALLFGAEDPAADYGRFILLLGLIYSDGWAIQLDSRKTLMMAQKLFFGSLDELNAYIERCVAVDLFDRDLWERERVLTSAGIQKRYLSARKVSKGKISGPWCLIDRDSPKTSEVSRDLPKTPENSREVPKNAEPYIREEKIREVKEREDEDKGSSSSSVDVEKSDDECVLMCMHPTRKGIAYTDNAGKVHRMAVGALQSSFVDAVPGGDFKLFARRVASLCPPGCRGHPDQVGVCLNVVLRALERFDPAKGSDPWVLTKKLLTEDRQVKDG